MLAKIAFDAYCIPQASFAKGVNPRLAKRPLEINGRLANLGLASLVKEATDDQGPVLLHGLFEIGIWISNYNS